MRKRVQTHVQTCTECQHRKRPAGFPYGKMEIPKSARPCEKYFIDFLGPFPLSDNGNKYILVIVDSFCRYVETASTPDATADTVINILTNQIVCRHGCFKYLVSDRAKCFKSVLMKEFANSLKFQHIFTTSFHPNPNLSERVNASIATSLSHYCSTSQNDWDLQLPSITFALNTTYNRSIKTTPYFLMYAREAVLPGEIPTLEQPLNQRINRWKIACRLAERHSQEVRKYNKSYYDKKRQDIRFCVGDKVFLFSPITKPGKATKLLKRWNGPMTITKVFSPINYEVQISPTKTDVVHVSRLKRYYQRPPATALPTAVNEINPETGEAEDSEQMGEVSSTVPLQDIQQSTQNQIPEPDPQIQRPPHTHRYRTRLSVRNALQLLILFLLLSRAISFDLIDPVQWHESERQVVKEIMPYNFRIDYKSPCEAFHRLNKTEKALSDWCDAVFTESFLSPLQDFCRIHDVSRVKRVIQFIPIMVGGVIVGAIGSGITSLIVRANSRAKIRDLVKQLNIIKDSVSKGLDASKHIKSALQIAGVEMNRTQLFAEAAINQLNSDVILATYLAIRLAEIRQTITNSANDFGYFQLTNQFLKIFNTSLPCGSDCPANMTTIINCHINDKETKLTFGVLARMPSKKLKILKANSFTLYNRTGIKNCYKTYSGPEFILFDSESKCSTPVPDFEKSKFIPYTKDSVDCDKTPFQSIEWSQEKCSIEHNFKLIQLKRGHNYNYIYCYEQNITINRKTLECPDQPFKLKINTSFRIANFNYGSEDMINQRANDYIWSEMINRFLTHVQRPENSSLDDYLREVGRIQIPDLQTIKTHSYHVFWIVAITSGTLVTVAVAYISLRLFLIRRHQRSFNSMRHDIALETARQLVTFLNPEMPSIQTQDIETPD